MSSAFSFEPSFELLSSLYLGQPSVKYPFGIRLWDLFNDVATYVTDNQYVPKNFAFQHNKQPLSNLPSCLAVIAIYYLIVFGGDYLFKKFKLTPWKLKFVSQIHNLILTIVSFILFALMVEQLFPIIYTHGLYYAICNINSWTQPLVALYYLNYLVKYVEFIDTFLLVLKQKKLTFLHTYHHGATALLCYTQLVGTTPISWVPISINLAVHIVMYWYYFLSSFGIKVWWKEWVTRFQIIQFLVDLAFIYFATYQKIVHTYFADVTFLPRCSDCEGTMYAAIWGCCILSSYLVLFIAFYIEVYKKPNTKKSKVVRRTKGGVAAKVNEYVNVEVSQVATPEPVSSSKK